MIFSYIDHMQDINWEYEKEATPFCKVTGNLSVIIPFFQ